MTGSSRGAQGQAGLGRVEQGCVGVRTGGQGLAGVNRSE